MLKKGDILIDSFLNNNLIRLASDILCTCCLNTLYVRVELTQRNYDRVTQACYSVSCRRCREVREVFTDYKVINHRGEEWVRFTEDSAQIRADIQDSIEGV